MADPLAGVVDLDEVELPYADRLAGRGRSEEGTGMRARDRDPHRHPVALGHQVFYLGPQVGKAGTELGDGSLEVGAEILFLE